MKFRGDLWIFIIIFYYVGIYCKRKYVVVEIKIISHWDLIIKTNTNNTYTNTYINSNNNTNINTNTNKNNTNTKTIF